VFETLLVRGGVPQLLGEHLQRWREGASWLQLPEPPNQQQVKQWIAEAMRRSNIADGALRINWSRGSGGRGLQPPAQAKGRCWGSLYPHQPSFQRQQVVISERVQRWADDPLKGCKTLDYSAMVLARLEANQAGASDVLLRSSQGGLCCGSSANLLVQEGGQWLTPPLSCGALPGVMRARGVAMGLIQEARLADSLPAEQPALLLNSLDCRPLNDIAEPLAEPLFVQLLGSD
jgi:branched-subunit amino acid aminotransferase/4-amino-4-deoxychorismate lyase